ncbi:MAG: helix-turn-helix transcriptional regulator [Desulfobacteraceae bacterium]|nr:helix-turn-helix transcriptional regulator [Desulfobacteraceae bacterium]
MTTNSSECFVVGIKALRDHGWQERDQKDIAKDIGYTTTHISQVFRAKRTPSPKLQDALSEEYGVLTENVIKIGRMILNGEGFFPFSGQVEHLPPNSEVQARKIVELTNKAFGIDGLLTTYQPKGWINFCNGETSPIDFYKVYVDELKALIAAIQKRW